MKKVLVYILFILTGAAIGYFIGITGGYSVWKLYEETFWGAALFCMFAFALFELENKYSVFIGAIIGLLVSLSLEWVAGSPIYLGNRLSFMFMCSFVGWGFKFYWRSVILGGFIGGILGFWWGLHRSHWFGHVSLAPGILNALLMSVEIAGIGMIFASLFMKSIGWRFIENKYQE